MPAQGSMAHPQRATGQPLTVLIHIPLELSNHSIESATALSSNTHECQTLQSVWADHAGWLRRSTLYHAHVDQC